MPVRWGIIGCGDVTEIKSGPGFQNARGSALVAAMRRTPGKAEDYAKRHGVPRWYTRVEDLIYDPEVDIVSIATPPSSHCALALQVCAAGKPAYVEKPMAVSSGECARMVEAFEAAELPLYVAYYRRAQPRFRKVKELLEQGAIGSPRSVTLQLLQPAPAWDPENLPWRVQPEIAGGGLFVDLASHSLDLLDDLLGPVSQAAGFATNQGSPYAAEDSVSLSFQLESGVVGTGLWQFSAGHNSDRFVIHGEKGTLSFATFANDPIRLVTGERKEEFNIPQPAAVQQPLIQAIVDELTGGPPSPSTGHTAARTTRVMETAIAAYYGIGT